MQSLTQVLAPWYGFYTLLGGASATMVGLLFVAASVSARVFSPNWRGARRIFLSASVVQFGGILAACLIVLAPIQAWESVGGLITAGGLFGLGYSAMAWRDTVRDGLTARIDWEDRTWYALLPAASYLCETVSGVALVIHLRLGCVALALSAGVMLVVAIHNAWDITLWSITRRDE
jgi:hypothetical protein